MSRKWMGWGLKEAKAKTIVVTTTVLLIHYRLLNNLLTVYVQAPSTLRHADGQKRGQSRDADITRLLCG